MNYTMITIMRAMIINGIHVIESINNPSFLTVDNYGVHTNDLFSDTSILNETFSINRLHESYDVQLQN